MAPLQGHYQRSKIESCDKSVRQNRKVSPEPNDFFGLNEIIGYGSNAPEGGKLSHNGRKALWDKCLAAGRSERSERSPAVKT